MIFSHRDKGFGDDREKGSGLVAIHEVEWGGVGDRMGAVIVCKLSSGKMVSPGEGVILAKDPEVDL